MKNHRVRYGVFHFSAVERVVQRWCGGRGSSRCEPRAPIRRKPATAIVAMALLIMPGILQAQVTGKNVYVAQIGDENHASVEQSGADAHADVQQRGDGNRAEITQNAISLVSASVNQVGNGNTMTAMQQGDAVNRLALHQQGGTNAFHSSQNSEGALYNSIVAVQNGDGNQISLTQSGEDNQATLAQNGDDNILTAQQNGAGNRLEWTQNGNNLSTPVIIQNGGSAIQVTQNGG